ncbi:hypothetical protein ACN2WE_24020 [Streptomyces sp. cg28]|uniref:hypothetical protein n=1 Tax=Streptomyces sp. cg28 TaxID=3403457 RepID=UPI003B226CEB
MMAQTSEIMRAALAADQVAAKQAADRYIARQFPAVAALLDDTARQHPEHVAPLTAAETTLVPDDGLGAHRTTPIETAAREISDVTPSAEIPWLSAEIVVTDYRSQAYGRRTQLWLHNNRDVAELTVDQARAHLAAARAFLDRFEVLVDHAETIAAGDFTGDPEIAAADQAAEDRRIRAVTARLGEARA